MSKYKPDVIDRLWQYMGLIVYFISLVIVFTAATVYITSDIDTTNATNAARDAFVEILVRWGVPFSLGVLFCVMILLVNEYRHKQRTKANLLREFLEFMDGG